MSTSDTLPGCAAAIAQATSASLSLISFHRALPSTTTAICDGSGSASRGSIVEEHAHQRRAAGASRLRAANSSTALTCSRVTGNCSITSSMVIPSSSLKDDGHERACTFEHPGAADPCRERSQPPGIRTNRALAMDRPPSDASLRDNGQGVIRRQASARMTSSCRNQLTTRFQLANVKIASILAAASSWSAGRTCRVGVER